MAELIEQYLEQFHENFPLFALMGVEEAEVEAIIQDCLDKGTPYRPPELDENPYIDDLTTPAFWPVVVFSYHFRRFPVVGGKQNRKNRGS